MKTVKLISLIMALVLSLTLAACNSTGGGETTPNGSNPQSTPAASSPAESTPEENPEPEYPEIDYMSMDLSQYITLGQYKDLAISVTPKREVDDAYVQEVLKEDLIYYGQTVKVTDRAVTKEDTVSISFIGLLDGVAFEGGTGDQDNFTIYDGGGFIDGFADALIGAMPGVETAIDVTFPEDYHSKDLAGKPVVFKVTVHHIYEAKELTDEVANDMTGGQYKTAKELLDYYKEALTDMEESDYNSRLEEAVWSAIFNGATTIAMPEDIINALYDYQIWWVEYYASIYGMSVDSYLAYDGYTRETLKAELANNVKQNMVVYAIVKAEEMTLTDEEYAQLIEDLGYTEEELLKDYTKEELIEILLFEKAYAEALKWQTVTDAVTEEENNG